MRKESRLGGFEHLAKRKRLPFHQGWLTRSGSRGVAHQEYKVKEQVASGQEKTTAFSLGSTNSSQVAWSLLSYNLDNSSFYLIMLDEV